MVVVLIVSNTSDLTSSFFSQTQTFLKTLNSAGQLHIHSDLASASSEGMNCKDDCHHNEFSGHGIPM